MEQEKSLKNKTIKGVIWSFGEVLGNQGFQFFIQIILARLLLPEHFGLIGMVIVFIALSNALVDSGFTQALIRKQNTTQTDYSTVFYFNMAISLIVYLVLYISAPHIANFFNEPELDLVIRILSIVIILNGLGIIPRTIIAKEVDFEIQAKINVTSSVLAGVLTVAMALNGFGVWSLIARTLATSLFQSLFLLLVKKWIPSMTFSISAFKNMFGFSWKVLVSDLINTLYKNIYFLIIGKQYSVSSLGYFTNAHKLSDLATYTLTTAIQRVSYPVLSSIQDEEVRLKQAFQRIIRVSAFLIFPVMAGLAAIAEPLVLLIFGEQWAPMTIYFQILCIAGMLYPINVLNLSILQVKGRAELFLYLELVKMGLSAIIIFLIIWLKLGMIYLVSVVLLDSFIALFLVINFSGKEISYPVRKQLRDIMPAYLVSLAMGALVLFQGELDFPSNLLQLAMQVSTGIVFFIISCKLLKIPELLTVYGLLVPIIKKIKLVFNS